MSPSHPVSVRSFQLPAFILLAIAVLSIGSRDAWAGDTPEAEIFALNDTKGLNARAVKVDAVEFKGRKAVRLLKESEGDGMAFLQGVSFRDGTIEADVAVKLTTPAGVRNPGFIGIAFRTSEDGSHYEMFYIRPGNSQAADQAMRNHSTQYVSMPNFDWEKLRRAWPWLYESYADLQLETWTKIKLEIAERRASLYLNDSPHPALIVDGLKGEDLKGGVALWGSPGQESYFSNVRVLHAMKAEAVSNDGEAAGEWQIRYSSDAGNYECSMQLRREGNALTGTWSGAIGSNLPVYGTWRHGYLELTLNGVWPGHEGGPATAMLAGWIDGKVARGRMKIEGHADGQWTAKLKE